MRLANQSRGVARAWVRIHAQNDTWNYQFMMCVECLITCCDCIGTLTSIIHSSLALMRSFFVVSVCANERLGNVIGKRYHGVRYKTCIKQACLCMCCAHALPVNDSHLMKLQASSERKNREGSTIVVAGCYVVAAIACTATCLIVCMLLDGPRQDEALSRSFEGALMAADVDEAAKSRPAPPRGVRVRVTVRFAPWYGHQLRFVFEPCRVRVQYVENPYDHIT